MNLIRARQRVLTAVFPHNGNRQYIVPNRKLEAPDPAPAPMPQPEAPPATQWTTHTAAEAWLDQFTERTGIGTPLDWSASATLAQKFQAALQLWQDYTT